jgi:hypothetical protein
MIRLTRLQHGAAREAADEDEALGGHGRKHVQLQMLQRVLQDGVEQLNQQLVRQLDGRYADAADGRAGDQPPGAEGVHQLRQRRCLNIPAAQLLQQRGETQPPERREARVRQAHQRLLVLPLVLRRKDGAGGFRARPSTCAQQ